MAVMFRLQIGLSIVYSMGYLCRAGWSIGREERSVILATFRITISSSEGETTLPLLSS